MDLHKNFRVNLIIRVLLLTAASLTLAWVLTNTIWFFTPLVITIILLLIVINLIFYVERTNKNLSQFLLNIKQGGFTTQFNTNSKGVNSELKEIFNEVLIQFQKVTLEKESHYQYLKTLNENLGVSLISYDSNGNIELMNSAAKQLLNKPYLKKIKDLENVDAIIYNTIQSMSSEEKRVIKSIIYGEQLQLSIQVKDFKNQDKQFRLVIIQNIHNELEEKEVEAWQKLISVLTHEIMNSVTPIASLSAAINQQISQDDASLEKDEFDDLKVSIATIENRSKGLMRFVNAYKDFTKRPDLTISEVDLKKVIDRVANLLSPDLQKSNIKFEIFSQTGSCIIKGDVELIEQVIINLLKNAIEVLDPTKTPYIKVSITKIGRKFNLSIKDNGIGISAENLDKIFVPFFTTKKKGTGIGLSFTRQIMRLHNGSISVKSEFGKGTEFVLSF